jgi:UDP-perosamine 4-acetyltransferase
MNVAIFGAGGLGRMVRDILCQAGRHRPVAFLDSDERKWRQRVDDLPVIGGTDAWPRLRDDGVRGLIVAIGNNAVRRRLATDLQARGAELVSAIHPLASIARTARLDQHVIVGPRVCICVHAAIGPHGVLSSGAIIEHDNVIGTAAFIHPAVRLAGGVLVEDEAVLGIGACVIPGRRVGRRAIVEPGAVVINHVAAEEIVGGVPAVARAAAQPRRAPSEALVTQTT